jgi:glycosyltransferase involved in cell wall biosynthesis
VIFPWGIDVQHFSPGQPAHSFRTALGWERNLVFICTRNWETVHAPLVVLEAFASLVAYVPEARLMMVGDGILAPEVHMSVNTLGLAPFVSLPGRLNNSTLADYLRSADIYVSATLSDGTSVSLLEAMACGLPVIVTDAHGNREWVTPNVNGWLAEPGRADSLAQALEQASRSTDLRPAMSVTNTELIRKRANWSANVQKLVSLLCEVGKAAA